MSATPTQNDRHETSPTNRASRRSTTKPATSAITVATPASMANASDTVVG